MFLCVPTQHESYPKLNKVEVEANYRARVNGCERLLVHEITAAKRLLRVAY